LEQTLPSTVQFIPVPFPEPVQPEREREREEERRPAHTAQAYARNLEYGISPFQNPYTRPPNSTNALTLQSTQASSAFADTAFADTGFQANDRTDTYQISNVSFSYTHIFSLDSGHTDFYLPFHPRGEQVTFISNLPILSFFLFYFSLLFLFLSIFLFLFPFCILFVQRTDYS
jgi:hypothetical protein